MPAPCFCSSPPPSRPRSARTAEARFANALDRLMPLLHNYLNEGGVWRENGIGADKVRRRMAPVGEVSVASVSYTHLDVYKRQGPTGWTN